jgi:iron complex outermembrane receptor protein
VAAAYSATQNRPYLADNTETRTPGYTLINAGVGAGFTNKQNKLICNIYVFADNIFDVVYQDHLSRLKYFEPYPMSPGPYHGIYNMGRNISVKLDFPF